MNTFEEVVSKFIIIFILYISGFLALKTAYNVYKHSIKELGYFIFLISFAVLGLATIFLIYV